jgi:ribosomal protein L33
MAKSKKTSAIEMKCAETGDILWIKGGNRQGREKLELSKFNKKTRKHMLYREKK